MTDDLRQKLDQYVADLFAQEDDVLQHIQNETTRHDMPAISLRDYEGRLLQILMLAVGARRVVEIGTLAGYSGTWLARALPEDGKLYTLDISEKHAAVARANFIHAGLGSRVEVLVGPALESLGQLEGTFDMVFIDADKGNYPLYLDWAINNVRPGGIIAAHNAFRGGQVVNPTTMDDRNMDRFNRTLAQHPQLEGTIIGVGDGMAVAIKRA